MIDTSNIIEVDAAGQGNIAETIFLQDAAGERAPCTLRYLRIHWHSGSGTATVTISIDDERGADYDTDMMTCPARGNGADLNFVNYTPPLWRVSARSAYLISWTDPGAARWTMVAGLEQVKGPPEVIP
jgi:hypothetical protein